MNAHAIDSLLAGHDWRVGQWVRHTDPKNKYHRGRYRIAAVEPGEVLVIDLPQGGQHREKADNWEIP